MKVHEYREMMRYLTRKEPTFSPQVASGEERVGFQEGGDIRNVIKEFEKEGTTPNSFVGPNGIEFKLVTGQFSGKPVYKAFYPKDYDFSKGAIGGSTATEFQPEYFFKHIMAPEGTYFDIEKNDFLPVDSTPEVPTVDPFSGQQVSAQDQAAFTQPQAEIFPQQPSPIEQFKAERQFQSEADAAARSGIPFTKTIQNYLGNLYSGPEIANMQEQIFGTSNLSGDTGIVSDLRHATAASQVRDKIADAVSMGYFNPAGILPQSLGLFGSQVLGAANEIQSIRPNMQSMRDIGEDLRANFYGATQVPYGQSATTTYNQLLNNPSLPSAQMRSQQEASARVTPRMAYGGRVSMSDGGLTTTVPPDKGPDSQGVESLFRRRYS